MSENFVTNINNGAMFVNDRKQSDKSPDFKGSAEIACPHCSTIHKTWLSAWKKKARNGSGFLSIAFTPDNVDINKPIPTKADDAFDLSNVAPVAPKVASPKPSGPKEPEIDFDDDIPF